MAFQEVSSQVKFPELEEAVLRFWREGGIFQQSVELRRKAPPFVFYEGPPTANGLPGIHHVLARAMKDLFPRYKTMKGYLVERKGGWDTHGLAVEIEVEKRLKLTGKLRLAGAHHRSDPERAAGRGEVRSRGVQPLLPPERVRVHR